MVKIQCVDEQGNICTVDVDVNSLVDDMKAILEVELGIPMDEQELITANGMVLCSNETLSAQGILGETQLTVRWQPLQEPQPQPLPQQPLPQPSPQPSPQQPRPDQRLPLHEVRERIEQIFNSRRTQGQGWHSVNVEDPNTQQRIYDYIQSRNVDENLETALEYAPELFVPVTMLYVDCEINKHKVKAFIDSGAQKSIISARLAEKCGLMRLINTKWKSLLRGIGAQEALGHIHMAVVNLGGLYIPCSFCVLKDDHIDMIIGLDQLKRHRMIIDLKENCLRIEDTAIPFLPDHEVPVANSLSEEELQNLRTEAGRTAENSSHPPTGVASAGTAQTPAVAATAGVPTHTTGSTTDASSLTSGSIRNAMTNENAVTALMSLTGVDRERAILLLEAAGWDVNVAMSLLLDD